MSFVRIPTWLLLCLSALLVPAVDGKCALMTDFKAPDGDTDLIIYGFSIDNTESGDSSLTAPFNASVGGVACAGTTENIDAKSKIQEFFCPKPLPGKNLEIVASKEKIYICKLIVSGHPKCNDYEKFDFEAGNCVCIYGLENGKCRSFAPCGENSKEEGSSCKCNQGYTMIASKCEKQGFSVQYSPLTGICNNYEKHDYCETQGDCPTYGYFHVIRQIYLSPGAEKCKIACDEECACKSFRLYNNGDCWLMSVACSDMDSTVAPWSYFTKKAPGQTCDDVKYDCRKAEVAYCKRVNDCGYWFNLRFAAGSKDTCETMCTKECACKGYYHDGGYGCWLKSIACSTRKYVTAFQQYAKVAKGDDCDYALEGRCRDAKFKYCRRSGDCWGHDIRSIVAGLEDCKRECDKECTCMAFWKDRGLGCYLKSIACNVLSHTYNTQDYYVKIAADQSCPREYGIEEPGVKD